MRTIKRIRRTLAWILIAAFTNPLANPTAYAQVPPNGVGDFTLYTSSSSGGASEPNILLLIDTSDSMNLPEGWREYPGAYDSHVEYLWNDINAISTSEVRYEQDGRISTGNGYVNNTPTGLYVWGTYSPDTTYTNTVTIRFPNTTAYQVGGSITLAGMPIPALNNTFPIIGLNSVDVFIAPPPGVSWNNSGYPMQGSSQTQQYSIWNNSGTMTASTGVTTLPAPTKPLGFWGGSSADARSQIWLAAINYANATEPGDPGPRWIYRKYLATDPVAGSALYWLPAGTAETDHRLWSNAFNRFLGADTVSRFGSVNGSADPIVRGGISFGNLPAQYSGYNQCQSSKDQLTPSTVFAPSSVPENSGKVLGQQWQRYERYLNLDNSLASSYPGSNSSTLSLSHFDGYLNGNRDLDKMAVDVNKTLPIRLKRPGNSSYGGWSDLKPDWGGYFFKDRLFLEFPGSYQFFNPLLALYGVSTAGIASTNDALIAGYKSLAVPGYYDSASSMNIGANTLTRTRSCSWTGQSQETDAGNLPRRDPLTLSYGGTCRDLGTTCSDGGNCAGVPDPDACAQPVNDNFYSRDNNNCHWINRSQLATKTFAGCQWNGARQPVPQGEGAGSTYYYGGSCVGSCTGPECPAAVNGGTNYCVNTTTSQQFGAVTYDSVLQTTDPTAGCSNRSDNGTVYYYGGSCIGDYRFPPGSSWNFTNVTDACDKSVTYASMTVDSVPMTDVRTDSSTAGCNDQDDTWESCVARHGNNNCPYQTCTNRVSSTSSGGTNYTVYDRVADTDNVMVHDCLADEGTTGPFMSQLPRNFGASWVSGAGNSADDKTLSYDTDRARGISSAPAYDVYSVNYLNWKFGPKSNGNPIGRKTRLQTSKDAMVQLVQATDGVRFGLMVFNRADTSHNTEGGNIVYAVQRMGTHNQTAIDAMSGADQAANAAALNNRQALIGNINGLVAVSQTPLTESLYEAYLYFRGEAPLFGRLATATADGSQAAAGCDKRAFSSPGNTVDCLGSSGDYVSPMMNSLDPNTGNPAACSKNFVIMMTDGGPEGDYSANAQIKALSYTDLASDTTVSPTQATASKQFESGGAPYGPVDAASTSYDGGYVWLDELAYYMANADMNTAISGRQPVNTYTIGFAGADSPVLSNAAAKGNGQYYVAQDAGALSAALAAAVAAIREWNPTLAAPTIPISSLNRSESASEAYLAFFGPSSSQAWDGTVKKFRLGQGSTDCGLDANGTAIALCLIGKTVLSGATVKNIEQVTIDPLTSQQTSIVNPATVSFWNPANIQDSSHANKGGTGQVLQDSANPSTRNVYTFIADPGAASEGVSGSTDLTSNVVDESSALITKARLGNAAMSEAQRGALINFIRGGNTGVAACSDAPAAGTACTSWRSWPHADVMHAKPAIVTYDPTPAADAESGASIASSQYLFYLSNDGLLHAVNAANGQEAWAFLVEEALAQIQALNANLAGQHLTLADGAPTAWVLDANGDGKIVAADGDKAYLYFGLRRGGRAYYALDISDVANPKFMWKIDRRAAGAQLCNPTCNTVSDFDELGYSWSTPVAGRIRALATGPAVIFGGGYDGNQDNFSATVADSMGRAMYVVNGLDGSPLKVFKNGSLAAGGGSLSGMDFSIPSTVAALNADLDSQGLLDRIYVGDTAANLWRFDIDSGDTANWTGKQLAALSNAFALPITVPNRKIMTPPVVVKQSYQGQNYDAVYVGSGDREHPLVTTSTDMMFMIKDFDLGLTATSGNLITPGNLYDVSNVFLASDLDAATFIANSGWYQSLQSGEKVFAQPTVFYNVLRFSTFNPTASLNACLPPGKGKPYALDARFGGSVPTSMAAASTTSKQDPGVSVAGTRGMYADPSLPVIVGGKVYLPICHDGICNFELLGSIGGASKMYWYRESK